MSEWTYIYASYALTWLSLVGFSVYIWRRLRQAERAYASTETSGGRS
jgi:hypothetical protein